MTQDQDWLDKSIRIMENSHHGKADSGDEPQAKGNGQSERSGANCR